MEDIDERALNYGEIKAIATGDNRIIEKNELEQEVSKLNLLRQNYLNEQYILQDKIVKGYPKAIEILNDKIGRIEEDEIHLQEYSKPLEDGFYEMNIRGTTYTEKKIAGQLLLECCKKIKELDEGYVGEYRGFKMYLSYNGFDNLYYLELKNKYSYEVELGNDVFGNIQRINNRLDNFANDIPELRNDLDDIYNQLEVAKLELGKPFEKEEELNAKQNRLIELNKELKLNEGEKNLFDENQEEEQEITEDDRDDIEYEKENY